MVALFEFENSRHLNLSRTSYYPILLMLFLVVTIISCISVKEEIPPDSFIVSGDIEGLDTDFMIRSYKDKEGNRTSDSIFVENGKFMYSAHIEQPTFIFIWPQVERTIKRIGRGYIPAKSSQLAFIAIPGEHIKFKGKVTDFIDAYPSGNNANDDLASINSRIFPIMNKSVNMTLRADSIPKEDSLHQILTDSIDILDKNVINLKKEFISQNSSSKAAVWYLSDMMLRHQITDEESVKYYDRMDSSLKEFPYYKEVTTRVKGIQSTITGATMADFKTSNTMDGTDFQFSSTRGKYVLIDFWGTWCGPCVAEMPTVKKYHEKYNESLYVLGINNGDTKERINNFVESKGYKWTQIQEGDGDDRLTLVFNVSGFPTKFIIDPEGKILHRFLGSGEQAFDILDSLLNKQQFN